MNALKASIQQITNVSSIINGELTPELFQNFDEVLNICNQLWQKQEQTKRAKQAEEDNLYITRTKCVEEDDETVRQREIADIFPESTNDFTEYSQKDTLEQIKEDESLQKKKILDLIAEEEYKLIGNFFLDLMEANCTASKDYVTVFNQKLKVFHSLFEKFSTCLDNSIDDTSYRGLTLLVGICQENYDELLLSGE